jgi:hypothetical protein
MSDLGLINFSTANHKFHFTVEKNISMNQPAKASQKTRAEQETENEAHRLKEQVNAAMAEVALHTASEEDSLLVAADRIERAARDLADALRELEQQRKASAEEL